MTLNSDPTSNDASISSQAGFTPATPPPDGQSPNMEMNEHDFRELRDGVDAMGVHDVQSGRLFGLIVHHLGHLCGFDAAQEDEKARKAAQEEEDKETAEQEQAEEDKKAQEQSLLNATPAYNTSPDGSFASTPEQAPPTDVPIVNQEGV